MQFSGNSLPFILSSLSIIFRISRLPDAQAATAPHMGSTLSSDRRTLTTSSSPSLHAASMHALSERDGSTLLSPMSTDTTSSHPLSQANLKSPPLHTSGSALPSSKSIF